MQNYHLSPELRSITSICVVEDVSKCPLGYTPILRTHDQDADADLWKDGFFGRRVTRYVCISKTQGKPEHVVQSVQILYERELPPEGHTLISQTADTSNKPFQKKQLCYKVNHFRANTESIVEIVILSKLKTPPDGFEHIGDINGMHFCVRKISAITRLNSQPLSYSITPGMPNSPNMYPNIVGSMQQSLGNISLGSTGTNSPASASMPTSPLAQGSYAYTSPSPQHPHILKHTNTLTQAQLSGLDGIPFVLNESLQLISRDSGIGNFFKPVINIKSENEIEAEYGYDFRTEKDILMTNGTDSHQTAANNAYYSHWDD